MLFGQKLGHILCLLFDEAAGVVEQVRLHVAHLAIKGDSELVHLLVHVLLHVFIIDSAHTRTTPSTQARHFRLVLLDAHLASHTASHTASSQHPQIVPHPRTCSHVIAIVSNGVLPRKVGSICVHIADVAAAVSPLNNLLTCLKF